MTTTTRTGPVADQADIAREFSDVKEEIRNANFLGATVLGASITSAGIAVPLLADRVHAVVIDQPVVVVGLAGVGVLAIVAALWQLLDVVLPRLNDKGSEGRANFITYAHTDPACIARLIAASTRADEIPTLSRIAKAKYRSLGRAGRLLKAAIVLLAAATALAITF
ncbi:Pycsar system effector family protein [Streptomyces syringium]|uniref:Pycsar system effector family protein n=1 Tax=Streptomyces syringium TaxID=76729 RepID=UPI0037D43A52